MRGGKLINAFQVKTNVRQVRLISYFFLLVVDWTIKTSTSQEEHGIQWTVWMQLDDLDFSDDLALLSHIHQQMQVKTTGVAAASVAVSLNMNKR
ncbi:unnamed protein product [Schistosoma margrebowiei]|uniref:Uncharacterized protein n=1 Tax=Schistosoma margrebowiei TaxID=48269 RepID=A0A183M644_9TREM|nr:unnamed protein product [Schistosoma margrebowiei]